jgi:hypothetical protein
MEFTPLIVIQQLDHCLSIMNYINIQLQPLYGKHRLLNVHDYVRNMKT